MGVVGVDSAGGRAMGKEKKGRWPADQVPVIECPFCHRACKAPLYKGAKQMVGGDARIAGVYRYRKCGGCAATYRTVELYAGGGEQVRI